MAVMAISVDPRWPRGVSDFKTVTLPCHACVSNFGLSIAGVHWCKSKKCLHSVSFRIFAAMNMIPLGVAVESCNSGRSLSSMVGGRSSVTVLGSPAKKIVFPLGAMQSAVCRSAGVKDCYSRVPASRAPQTP